MFRREFLSLFPAAIAGAAFGQTANSGFNRWIAEFRERALQAGVRADIFDRAFQGISFNTTVLERDRTQNEFTKAIWDYLDTAVSEARIRNGQRALRDHATLLRGVESTYGVDKEIVAAIWGLESAYGAVRGNTPVVEAMATLAYDGRRKNFFESELMAALRILQDGHTGPENMRGSWAGAMGHTQFMPSSFETFAVDANGDGRKDIWSDDPTDALASTGHYLREHGWTLGQPWGVEVRLPEGFDYLQAARDITRLPSDWAAMGVVALDGGAVADHGMASVLLPAGAAGPAFLIFDNFEVLEHYNTADAYVIGVGHLADRIAGGDAIQHAWPRQDRVLTYAERQELQRRLTAAGFDTEVVDGLIGPLTINAIRRYQQANGLVPDGYASLRLLQRLR